jgi:hypothetical protein
MPAKRPEKRPFRQDSGHGADLALRGRTAPLTLEIPHSRGNLMEKIRTEFKSWLMKACARLGIRAP